MRTFFGLERHGYPASVASTFAENTETTATTEIDVAIARDPTPIVAMMQDYLVELTHGELTAYPQLSLYWTRHSHVPFVIRVRASIAGFALVRDHEASGIRELAEFYVEPAQRRRGVGSRAAALLFSRYPGWWSLNVFRENRPAQRFWRRVVPTPLVERAESTPDGRRYTVFQFLCDDADA